MTKLAERTNNKYISILTNYYKIASEIGTAEFRHKLLNSALEQYNDNLVFRSKMRKELNGPIRDAYMILAMIPLMILFQIATNSDYFVFITTVTLGKIGIAAAALVFIIGLWFATYKIGAPIEE